MKKNVKYKLVLIILCIVFFFSLMYFTLNKGEYISFGFLKDFIYSYIPVDTNNNTDIVGTNINLELENDIEQLKKMLNISSMTDFDKVNATVIGRNTSLWLNNLTINKGKKDGIEVGDAVVVGEGLIGKIESITNNTSIVKLITSNDKFNKVSVKLLNNGKYIYKIVESSENNLIISGIDNNIKVDKNAVIVTSGLSDKYPSGIIIGKIKKVSDDKYGISQKIYVESLVDFNNIKFVTVLGRKI